MKLHNLLLWIAASEAIGVVIPPSKSEFDSSLQINALQQISKIQGQLNHLVHDDSYFKETKKVEGLKRKIDSHLHRYVQDNVCLNYVFDQEVMEKGRVDDNVLINIKVNPLRPNNYNENGIKMQQLNVNIIDDKVDVIRRKNDLTKEIKFLLDFPISDKPLNIQVCLENLLVDRSWKSSKRWMDLYKPVEITLDFGIKSIVEDFEKLNEKLSPLEVDLEKVESETNGLVDQFANTVLKQEVEKRNFNEDMFSNVLIFRIAHLVGLFLVGLIQALWLWRFLTRRCT